MKHWCISGIELFFIAVLLTGDALAFDIVNRWTTTQIDGPGISRGDSITLLWSIVPDGQSYDRSSNSDLIQYMDNLWDVPQAEQMPDLTNRVWFGHIQDAYDQYSYVSGLNMIYVPELDTSGASTGQFGDIRIGGEAFDDPNDNTNVLANSTFPNSGDMLIDTTPGDLAQNGALLRNIISHESGHGVGLGHSDITGAKAVMQSFIQTNFFGLQFDDIYAFNRLYGDPLEKNGSNDTPATSTQLGSFSQSASVSLGTDAGDSVAKEFDNDWLGIDGSSDTDWFRFTIPNGGVARINVTPQGPTYTTAKQGLFNAAAQSDLSLDLYASDLTPIVSENTSGLGEAETTGDIRLSQPGEYFIRVTGAQDVNQFYEIDMDFTVDGLVLEVDPRSGAMAITTLGSQSVSLIGYSIESTDNVLVPDNGGWNSLADQQIGTWAEANSSSTVLNELNPGSPIETAPNDSLQLGTPFQPTVTEPFGTRHDPQPISFSYLTAGGEGSRLEGKVVFTGDPLFNNLVLSVDPDTGEAILTNESNTIVDLIGYTIESDSGSLVPSTWISLEGQLIDGWYEANPSSQFITEFHPVESSQLAPFEVFQLGQLFDPNGERDLGLTFFLDGSTEVWDGEVVFESVIMSVPGDFNRDGFVNETDLDIWELSYGINGLGDADADGDSDGLDFLIWQRNISGEATTELLQSVPEPHSVILITLVIVLVTSYSRSLHTKKSADQEYIIVISSDSKSLS